MEHQSGKYVSGLPAWMKPVVYPLPFIYESTGAETRFTNGYDPDARSRRVFTFHRPQTLAERAQQIIDHSAVPIFRARLKAMPPLDERGLWGKRAEAIRNVERSLAEDRPRVLIQMATGSGKTFTAANLCYRLIRYAGAQLRQYVTGNGWRTCRAKILDNALSGFCKAELVANQQTEAPDNEITLEVLGPPPAKDGANSIFAIR